jgi:hypothetical protein
VHPSSLPHMRHMTCQSHPSRFNHPHNMGKEYRSFSSSLYNFLHSRHLIPLRPKYPPQHPQSTFLPQCQWPSFTPIQNNGQNYSSIYLDL